VILRAAEEVGDSQEVGKDGNGGALAYLKVSAIKERKTFQLMMARILSTKIHSEVRQVKENLSLTEAVAELKAYGLDEKRYPVERDEEDCAFADLTDVTILDQPATEKPAIDVSPNASTPPASKDGNSGALAYLKVSAIKERKTDTGAVWVFIRSGGVWIQQGNKLVGTGAVGSAGQGVSVALSTDGNTAIVGGLADNKTTGAAWVYRRSGNAWTQQGNKLVGTGAVGAASQGSSVALSGDGSTAIMGGPGDHADLGATWVFARSGDVWTQQGNKLVGTGAVGAASQGSSVALSGDGSIAIMGGVEDNSYIGAAWVFIRGRGVWNQQGSKLVGSDAIGNARQGHSVALSGDGSTAMVGGLADDRVTGAAWVFTRSSGVWITPPKYLSD
jgi:hypothetical protein